MTDWIENIPSAWKGHREFATWLTEYLKPKDTIDLGVDFGYSTFVWQLANELHNPEGMVTGIDLFSGDSQTGIRDTHDQVSYNILNHGLTGIEIIVSDFAEASAKWNRKVGIIHIDGYHSKEAVTTDFTNWIGHLEEDGIMLFHDVSVRQPGFGVEEFFGELKVDGYKKLKFEHSAGLGILTKNERLYQDIVAKYTNVYRVD